jgi:hypothetical protein
LLGSWFQARRAVIHHCEALLVVLSALAGCSASDGRAAVAASAHSFLRAAERNDGRTACSLLSAETAGELAKAGSTCIEKVVEIGLRDGPDRDVQVWGDRAQVRLDRDTVFLAEFAERGWKVTAAGCRPRRRQPYDCEIEG